MKCVSSARGVRECACQLCNSLDIFMPSGIKTQKESQCNREISLYPDLSENSENK